jgi:hypothetical protein
MFYQKEEYLAKGSGKYYIVNINLISPCYPITRVVVQEHGIVTVKGYQSPIILDIKQLRVLENKYYFQIVVI